MLEAYPHLTAADLVNVCAYADAHLEEIAIALQEQEAAMQEKRDAPVEHLSTFSEI